MKNKILIIIVLFSAISCNKVQEKITGTAEDAIKETIENSLGNLAKADNAGFDEIFPDNDSVKISEFKGKKVKIFTGKEVYIFKYKTDKNRLIPFLENQKTEREEESDQSVKKIDRKDVLGKISIFEKFLPESIISTGIIDEIKNDEGIEYYKLKRFPNNSTIIYNPKNKQVFQFVEVD